MFSNKIPELDDFIGKVKQNIDSIIFTMNMAEKPLSEVADFLEIFVPEVKVQNHPEQVSHFTSGEEDDERNNKRSGSGNECITTSDTTDGMGRKLVNRIKFAEDRRLKTCIHSTQIPGTATFLKR